MLITKKKGGFRANAIYQIFHNLQKIDKSFIKLKKRGQRNEPSFWFLIRLQNIKNEY